MIEEDKKSDDNKKSANWPIKIKVWGKENEFRNWSEVLTTLIGMLCDKNNDNYNLLAESSELKKLEFSPSEKGAGKRRKINSQAFPDQYIKIGFYRDTVIDLCKKAMEITGYDPDDFQVLNGL